ncbi:carbohydrate ABC transporter permease [Ruficoccus amylovorans]|uniref:sn-glycerol-3-phosphate transport system permease protein UgpE n=1 Tax=Ruficoccus amylovorans TaxID=1804625 RepID=A0A842HCD6_9BACT|nr:carbohydrate ABC transporter permease [Ruficoccus amylovorans]MBC2593356.1 carbohydrate ABC transporter permease [Ruficoccus amylovorans]
MPIFTTVESKTTAGKCFHAAVFVLLSLGAVTMLYPLLLLVSGSFRSELDENELGLVPRYFYDGDALYRKFLEYKYEQRVGDLNAAHLSRDYSFAQAAPPSAGSETAARDLRAFVLEADLPAHWQALGGSSGLLTIPRNLRELRGRVRARFDGDVTAYARDTGTAVGSWTQLTMPPPEWLSTRYDYTPNALHGEYTRLLREAPPAQRRLVSLSGMFLTQVVFPRYGSLERLNETLGLDLGSYGEFRLPQRVPSEEQAAFREAWVAFVSRELNPSFVVLEGVPAEDYQGFLATRYGGDIAALNREWGSDFAAFAGVLLPDGDYLSGAARRDYGEFLLAVGPEHWLLTGPEYAWTDWLRKKYGTPEALSREYDGVYPNFEYAWLPQSGLEALYVREHAGALRWQFATRNFVNVIDAIAFEGRVLRNTVIFCALSVLAAVLVNPLAAYALSRFRLPGGYKVLFLMMAVMAFPPMVTTIPVFLMLQKLSLMNTFAGLLLPTVANGYLIFLLKGFFDSLPRELYEAAQLEGASEARMFFTITMALSKPILAVVALSAFNAAYTLFLFAIIVAPEQEMWLLPVWLYQYRETVSSGGVYASVLLAAIPPLLVFIFAQKIILRGIVVPTEK